MITVSQADAFLLQHLFSVPTESVPLTESLGRILRDDIVADRDQPAADISAMDGIAIAMAGYARGVRQFFVQGIQRAGMPALVLADRNSCLEIMTGACLPTGCDCVIPYEELIRRENTCEIPPTSRQPQRGQFIRAQASSYKVNDMLVEGGCRLTPAHIGVLAAVGKSAVEVAALPRIAILGTGDELVPVSATPECFQSRQSNAPALAAVLRKNGFADVTFSHLPDDQSLLKDVVSSLVEKSDVLVVVGGISRGKFDFVPAVLAEMGAEIIFHRVNQRPGKPLLFARTQDKKPIFGLPGNPVSAQICLYRYVLPYLQNSLGYRTSCPEEVVLDEAFDNTTDATRFIPVQTKMKAGVIVACSVLVHDSGDFLALTRAQGFFEIPGASRFRGGDVVKFFRF